MFSHATFIIRTSLTNTDNLSLLMATDIVRLRVGGLTGGLENRIFVILMML